MTEGSWPPTVRESHEPERPRDSAPDPAVPGTPEAIGAVPSERTEVVAPELPVEETELDAEEGEPKPRGRLLTGLLIGGLVVMTALAATFLAMLLGEGDSEDVRAYLDKERPVVENTARSAVDILINYDTASIEERRDEMLAISTGGFREDYSEFTDTLRPLLEEAAASSRGSILEEPRITFTSPEQADAIVRTEQIAQTRENPSGRTVEYILRLGLIDTQGGWKVDNIEILSTEVS
jgi:Mce-associated membrane protein